MTTNTDVMNELANAANAAQELANQVESKVTQINTAVNSAIENVNAAIPNAVKLQMSQTIYLDENNGDDNNNGTISSPKATFKACIQAAPSGSSINLRIKNGSNLTVNESFVISNLKVNIIPEGGDVTLLIIANAKVYVYSSTISAYYVTKEIIQNVLTVFEVSNSSIIIPVKKITLRGNSSSFYSTNKRAPLQSPGGFVSELGIYGATIDSSLVTGYTVFEVDDFNSMILAMYKDLVVSENTKIVADEYTPLRIGTENIYILGA